MLTKKQIKFIAKKINDEVNIPILGEKAEYAIFKFGIKKAAKFLDDELPSEFVDFLNDTAEGFDLENSSDLDQMKSNMVDSLNKKVNIPLLNEDTEKTLFKSLIDVLFEAMKKGKKLEK